LVPVLVVLKTIEKLERFGSALVDHRELARFVGPLALLRIRPRRRHDRRLRSNRS